MTNQISAAEVYQGSISVNSIKIDVFLLPDGSPVLSERGLANALGLSQPSLAAVSKPENTALAEEFCAETRPDTNRHQLLSEDDRLVEIIPLDIAVTFCLDQASQGNKQAIQLIHELALQGFQNFIQFQNKPSQTDDFEQTMTYVLSKNRELYERLA